MSSTRTLRRVLVLAVAVGLAVGPAGAVVAAPERGEEAPVSGWATELAQWMSEAFGRLLGTQQAPSDSDTANPDGQPPKTENNNCSDCSDGGGTIDPDG